MSMYLAIHEAPCVGVAPVAFDADNDAQAEVYAFEQSVTEPHFVIGGYDLYRIVWNPRTHVHELTPVTPESACTEDVAPDTLVVVCDTDFDPDPDVLCDFYCEERDRVCLTLM